MCFRSLSRFKQPSTERFIKKWLRNENQTLATYMKENTTEDIDLVKGRESLSETLGLWMIYAVKKEDKDMFNEAHNQLTHLFMENDGYVNWKLTQYGESEVFANALIDDVRIADALLSATEKWGISIYKQTARSIVNYLMTHNVNKGCFTDYYERNDQYASDTITLSYINISHMNHLKQAGLLDYKLIQNTIRTLENAPVFNGFYPKNYNVMEKEYIFDDDINLIDQILVAYHLTEAQKDTGELLHFVMKEMNKQGCIYGRYDRVTKKPTVDYESPAIYGLLILYALECKELTFAKTLYKQMNKEKITCETEEYYGGYSVYEHDTHIFDNLIPLLAEQKLNEI